MVALRKRQEETDCLGIASVSLNAAGLSSEPSCQTMLIWPHRRDGGYRKRAGVVG